MKVGVNCLNIQPNFVGGVNTFTCGLLRGLAARAKGHRFRLFVTSRNRYLFEEFQSLQGFEIDVLDDGRRALRDYACRVALLPGNEAFYAMASNQIHRAARERIESGVDLTYTPTTVLRYFNPRKPAILSMHDIQHVHFPEFFSRARRLSRRITYGLSARHATRLQASSEFIKRDLLEHFPSLREEQVAVVPEGVCVEQFRQPCDTPEVAARYRLPERFLLYPAQMWRHKNHITLLKALKQIETAGGLRIPLILTGGRYEGAQPVFDFIESERMAYVRHLGKIPLADLVALYKMAAFLVMPSLHESSSLPVLEAAAAGTAILASRIPPNQEMAQTLALDLFSPQDVDELASAIRALWRDPQAAAAQAALNRERVKAYSWENAAEKFLRLCEAVAAA